MPVCVPPTRCNKMWVYFIIPVLHIRKLKIRNTFWTHLRSSNLQIWRFQFQVVWCNLILPYMYYFHFYRCVNVFVVCVYVCMCAWNKKNNWFMIGNVLYFASLVAQRVKNLPAVQKIWVQSLSWEDPLEKGMAIHSRIIFYSFQKTTY